MTPPEQPACGLPSRRARGRPADPAKREAVIEAAWQQLLQRGYDGMTIEAVAAAAGVARGTLYKSFPDKESLFEAVIAREVDRIAAPGAEASSDQGASLRERLVAFGVRLVGRATDPAIHAAGVLFAMETARRPELGRKIYELGGARVLDALATLIAEGIAAGEIEPDDPRLAAEDLQGLWHRSEIDRLRHGIASPLDPEDLRGRVARGVGLFLRAHAPRG